MATNKKPKDATSKNSKSAKRNPDWVAHFRWLASQKAEGINLIEELESDRQRQRAKEDALESLL